MTAIPNVELRRLERLTAGLKTAEGAVATLGEPDRREPRGLTIHSPGRARRPARGDTGAAFAESPRTSDPGDGWSHEPGAFTVHQLAVAR